MLKLLKNFSKKDWILIFICIVLVATGVWLDLKLPDYMRAITVLVESDNTKISLVVEQGFYMLICAFFSLLTAVVVGYLSTLISATLSKTIRKKLFDKIESFGIEEIDKFSTSSLITRTTNDITNIQMLISMGLQLIIKAPIMIVWAILKILNKNFTWSVITAGFTVVMILVVIILMILVFPRFKIVQKLIDNLNNMARENLTGVRVVHAFNAEKYQEEKFDKANNDLTNVQLFTQRVMAIFSPFIYLIMNLLSLTIYFTGAKLINGALLQDKITLFGDMVVFSTYAMQIIISILMLAMIFIMYPRASVSAGRINEVLNTKTKIKNGSFDGKTKKKGVVEFKHVYFKYPESDEYALSDISFVAQPKEVVAFIGSCGSGKSTLINLIPRFYDVSKGEVLVDGINVKDYKLKALNEKLGYISQKPAIFNGGVNYNVAFGKYLSDEEVMDALDIAQAKEFVLKMKDKYDSNIASGGVNISGGQKQRISVARAIARKPEIYIFDDSFSALDYKTDYNLRKALKDKMGDATCLIVAQRISTIKNADKIIVLDNGKVAGIGSHKDLLKTCEVYKEIVKSQVFEGGDVK